MSEAQEQEVIIQWADLHGLPLFHIPNGGKRNAAEAAHLKRQGVRAGVPDLFLPIARAGFHGLFIELKSGKNKATDKQIEWIKRLNDNGYLARICYGANNAIALIELYLRS